MPKITNFDEFEDLSWRQRMVPLRPKKPLRKKVDYGSSPHARARSESPDAHRAPPASADSAAFGDVLMIPIGTWGFPVAKSSERPGVSLGASGAEDVALLLGISSTTLNPRYRDQYLVVYPTRISGLKSEIAFRLFPHVFPFDWVASLYPDEHRGRLDERQTYVMRAALSKARRDTARESK